MIKFHLAEKCRNLCSEETKLSEWLFGNDLKDSLKDVDLEDKLARNYTQSKNWRGMK